MNGDTCVWLRLCILHVPHEYNHTCFFEYRHASIIQKRSYNNKLFHILHWTVLSFVSRQHVSTCHSGYHQVFNGPLYIMPQFTAM